MNKALRLTEDDVNKSRREVDKVYEIYKKARKASKGKEG